MKAQRGSRRIALLFLYPQHQRGVGGLSHAPVALPPPGGVKTDIHAPGGIRTHNPSKRAAAGSRLRPHGHWDPNLPVTFQNINVISNYNVLNVV